MLADSCGLVLLLVGGLVWLAWTWRCHQQPLSHTTAITATVHRLLKPRTPSECPACRRRMAAAGNAPTRAPLTPWCKVKSRRGAMGRIATQGFACPNRTCAVLSDLGCTGP